MPTSLQRLQILPPAAWPFSTAESMIWGYEADYHLVRNLYRLAGALKANLCGEATSARPELKLPQQSYSNCSESSNTPRSLLPYSAEDSTLFPSIKRKAFLSIRLLHFPSLQAKIAGGNY